MENDLGSLVDLYIPRKCSASNRIIHAKDHASIQLTLADVDPETGRMTDTHKMYAICGAIRRMVGFYVHGESDDCIVRLTKNDGLLSKNF
ncbi:PREDICTED: LOW QUALITY PROTEIN: 40S ribosomal protein S21 [Acromyrmex echinatior]|uniref:LOW QUALITY PROTEIN: 40S ribosomal protein S21 n=1 Tax=Acromyrmex echinatior TaxID=103372 RepID=UPI000580D5CC|nr:PREDICTED: LOW QUALITY PROTEIN: 40S ribosomal protein S21 [Acromyrmex echinatior]